MALKTIDLTKVDEQLTVLVHGDSGAGKTRFAASFPRPLFLSPEDEKGWETLKFLPRSALYDPDVKPMVWSVSEPRDFPEAFNRLVPLVQQKRIQTVVVDSLSFYADMFYNAITANQAGSGDGWKAYGLLNDHLRRIRIELHKLECHVVWLAVTRQPDEPTKAAVPNLKGQQAIMFPAGCKYVWYMQAVHAGKGPVRHELRTKKFGQALARGRDGGRLPDPIINPTFRQIVELLSQINPDEFEDQSEEQIAEQLAEETGVAIEAPAAAAQPAQPLTRQPAQAPRTAPRAAPIRRPSPTGSGR